MNDILNNEHHALLCIGRFAREDVEELFASQDPDAHALCLDSMSIDTVRTLRRYAYQKPVQASHRRFGLLVREITHEAQNALLKLFEDPPEHARFVLFIPREDQLLPTLRSRLHLVVYGKRDTEADVTDEFLRLSYAERLKIIGEYTKAKDTAWIAGLVRSLESYTRTHVKERSAPESLLVSEYISNRGASAKMLLEHLALSLPVVH